jgi:chemotaxis protein methyltransferase CheR
MKSFEPEMLGLPRTGLPVLGERLAPIVIERGFRSFLELYYLLKYGAPDAEAVWLRVMDALSVPETYFWREIDQIRAVVCRVIPELVRRTPGVLRIWSAPCATGEEPLTIAMVLHEAGWFDRAAIEIHASDGSPGAIAKARVGRYRERAFRSLPPGLREKYFRSDGHESVPVPTLAASVTSWSIVNLMAADEVAPYLHAPIVFCRNAFIYFSPQSVKAVVANFAERMPAPGYLCVGAAESLLSATTAFALEEIDGAFVYVKR